MHLRVPTFRQGFLSCASAMNALRASRTPPPPVRRMKRSCSDGIDVLSMDTGAWSCESYDGPRPVDAVFRWGLVAFRDPPTTIGDQAVRIDRPSEGTELAEVTLPCRAECLTNSCRSSWPGWFHCLGLASRPARAEPPRVSCARARVWSGRRKERVGPDAGRHSSRRRHLSAGPRRQAGSGAVSRALDPDAL